MSDSGEGRTSATTGEVLLVSSFFAMLTGTIEAGLKAFRILVLHRIIGVSPDFVWMTPLAYLLFFIPGALLLVLVFWRARARLTLASASGIFGFLGVFALLLPYTELATIAEAMVAGGVAAQVYRWVRADPMRGRARLRTGSIALAALLVVVGGGTATWRALAARREFASMPPYVKGKPNVLLIIFDTVRRANVSLYGYERPTTPEITRWASTGVVFDHAIAPAPWTLPTHASLFTGERPGALDADWLHPLPDDGPPTLAEVLRARGYYTAGFVSNHFYTSYESGLERGFVLYDDYRLSLRLILANAAFGRSEVFNYAIDHRTPYGFYVALRHFNFRRAIRPSHIPRLAPQVTEAFLDWQKETGDRPFFAFINYMGAHRPYRAYEPWLTMFTSHPNRRVDGYDAAIARLDNELGRMLDTLERRGVLANTLVVMASDHGEHFREHGLEEHGNSLYRELLEVPLVMRFPAGMPAGRRIGAMVSLRDVGATILDVTGNADHQHFPGSSLARYWGATPPAADTPILSELSKGVNVEMNYRNSRAGLRSIMDARFHYIHNDVGSEELYEYATDSTEAHNLAGSPAAHADLERLRRQLAAAMTDGGGPPAQPN